MCERERERVCVCVCVCACVSVHANSNLPWVDMRIPTDLELDHSCTVAHVRTGVHAHVLIHEPAPLAAKLSDRRTEEKRKRKKNRTGVHAVVLIHEPVALEEPAVVNCTVAARFS